MGSPCSPVYTDKSTFVCPLPSLKIKRRSWRRPWGALWAVAAFPQTFMGLPLSVHKLRLADWRPLITVIDNYILGWYGKVLTPTHHKENE
jgi:hypothetical protein